MSNVKSIIVCVFLSVYIVACASNVEIGNNSYYGKLRLNQVIYDDGDFKDLSNKSGHSMKIDTPIGRYVLTK